MKRILFSLVVALILSAMVVPAALAAPAYSSIQVLNLGTTNADIYIYYYDQSGALVTLPGGLTNPFHDVVNIGQSNTYFPVHTADGFNGSVVIESTEPIAVISNILYTSTPMAQSSWVGFEQGGPVLRFPLIMKNNNYNNTTFNVQNTTSASVNILIEFTPEPGKGFAAIANVSDTIPAWAAHTYDQRVMPQFNVVGTGKWIGSAKVTVQGTGAIAGVAQQIDSARQTASAYNGFLAGSAVVEAPLLMKENNNMWTSVNCQNLGPGPTDVTVNYVPAAGFPPLASETKTGIPANGTAIIFQYGPPRWIGAGQITNSANNQLACIMNQTNLVFYYASAYEGFDGSLATNTSVAPLVQFQPQAGGWLWTSLNVKNLSGSNATITVDFKPAPGFADVPDMTQPAAAGAVAVFFFYNPYGNGTKAIGGAEIRSNVGNVAVVVNQQKVNYVGDVYSTYDGFAK